VKTNYCKAIFVGKAVPGKNNSLLSNARCAVGRLAHGTGSSALSCGGITTDENGLSPFPNAVLLSILIGIISIVNFCQP
jgi:hypothetical protein